MEIKPPFSCAFHHLISVPAKNHLAPNEIIIIYVLFSHNLCVIIYNPQHEQPLLLLHECLTGKKIPSVMTALSEI